MNKIKSVPISKRMVWDAYLHIKRNKGAAGIDNQSIEDFEGNLENNLYKLWNRMASGSYFPPPVKLVDIPKKNGELRTLGIPTVADRIAQMVIVKHLTPQLELLFDEDSYGYRPGKSAIEAVRVARSRTWQTPWVIDLDIAGFFDNIDHNLLLKALLHCKIERWPMFYVEHWLKAGQINSQGEFVERKLGTPQGGVISPLLANLFMHFVFDKWMRKHYPSIKFIRYADDIIVHCYSKTEAEKILLAIKARLSNCKLSLNEHKSKIVYAGLNKQYKDFPNKSFDFLGFTFRKRLAYSSKTRKGFVSVLPAISNQAKKAIRKEIKSWRLHLRNNQSLEELAKATNPIVRGWVNYYGKFYRSELTQLFCQIQEYLKRWARRKFAKKTGLARKDKAYKYLGRVQKHQPRLFIHWQYGMGSPAE